ncbi:MAG: hypothetical protein ABIP63_10605 [Thermoanaerobaculia bacterium]
MRLPFKFPAVPSALDSFDGEELLAAIREKREGVRVSPVTDALQTAQR